MKKKKLKQPQIDKTYTAWTPDQLDTLVATAGSPSEQNAVKAWWRKNAPAEYRNLLDATPVEVLSAN